MVWKRDLTWGGEHRLQYADDILWNFISETYLTLLTIHPINSIKIKNEYNLKKARMYKRCCV